MLKNGLFLISIGMICFIYSVNAQTGTYNWPNLIVSIFFIILGISLFIKGNKKEKKRVEEENRGNR
jgi:uncharacterized membrane protein YdjX (TVP38/TMEM64 family)